MQKIILYGAGRVGHTLIELAEKYGIKEVIDSVCDENHIGEKIKDIPITSYSDAKKKKLPFLISTGARIREEIQNILGISRSAAYELIRETYKMQHPFKVLKIGNLYRVPKVPFDNWLNGETE